jgi:hypothetical protein
MYAELALMQLFIKEGETELPDEVKEDRELNRVKKTMELEEYDVFTWKMEKVKPKKPLRQNPHAVDRLINDL